MAYLMRCPTINCPNGGDKGNWQVSADREGRKVQCPVCNEECIVPKKEVLKGKTPPKAISVKDPAPRYFEQKKKGEKTRQERRGLW